MVPTSRDACHDSPNRARFSLARVGQSCVRLLRLWMWRARSRRELAGLHPDQLREVGLDAAMVKREAAKPFWKP